MRQSFRTMKFRLWLVGGYFRVMRAQHATLAAYPLMFWVTMRGTFRTYPTTVEQFAEYLRHGDTVKLAGTADSKGHVW